MSKSTKSILVPVRLARRGGLEGFSSTVEGGFFATSLGTLVAIIAAGRKVELECLWLTEGGATGAEPEWLAHHYPGVVLR